MMPPGNRQDFEDLEASQLYCPACKRAMPVRKRQGGSPEADWLRAEQELKSRQKALPRNRVLKRKAAS
jgi:hypothetical protein